MELRVYLLCFMNEIEKVLQRLYNRHILIIEGVELAAIPSNDGKQLDLVPWSNGMISATIDSFPLVDVVVSSIASLIMSSIAVVATANKVIGILLVGIVVTG
jgi:hypothetical protein